MPASLIVTLSAISAGALFYWAESKVAIVISELGAIRENLENLRALAENDVLVEAEAEDEDAKVNV
jgi:hypothetical protein